VAQVSAVLARLVRQERAALALLRKAEAPTKGANVHLAEVVDLFPAGVEPGLWASWDEEARYTFHERLGIGDELGMDKSEAHRWAVIEAKLTAADVPRALRPLLGEALEMGFTLEKGPVVESQTKGGTMKDQPRGSAGDPARDWRGDSGPRPGPRKRWPVGQGLLLFRRRR
jgi:hypothetical protein